MMTLEICELIE